MIISTILSEIVIFESVIFISFSLYNNYVIWVFNFIFGPLPKCILIYCINKIDLIILSLIYRFKLFSS